MKKLLVLALAAIMVLSLAAVSMAAVTVGGEVNYGWNLLDKKTQGNNNQSQNDFGDVKVTATAALNDEVTAFAALKAGSGTFTDNAGVGIDETWVKFTEGFGSVKVGYFGWNIKENLDIISLDGDLKSDCGVNVVAKASDAVTVDFYTSEQYDKTTTGEDGGFLYGIKVKYDTDIFGVSLATAKNSYNDDAESPISLNGYYKMDAFTFFLNYIPEHKEAITVAGVPVVGKVKSAIIGATYDSADSPIYARLEYDVQPTEDSETPMGFRIGYKINGAKLEYQTKIECNKPEDTKATSYLKLNCVF